MNPQHARHAVSRWAQRLARRLCNIAPHAATTKLAPPEVIRCLQPLTLTGNQCNPQYPLVGCCWQIQGDYSLHASFLLEGAVQLLRLNYSTECAIDTTRQSCKDTRFLCRSPHFLQLLKFWTCQINAIPQELCSVSLMGPGQIGPMSESIATCPSIRHDHEGLKCILTCRTVSMTI